MVDGTGGPSRHADVVIVDGRIAGVGDVTAEAGDSVVDLAGLVLSPGFIDTHTHYDAQVLWDGELTPSCWHGVTTVVQGNCGFGIAPAHPDHRNVLLETLEHVEGMHLPTLQAGVRWDFESFPEYLDVLDRTPTRLNVATFIGHTPLRIAVLGPEAASERAATADELSTMRLLLRDALDAGALGMSSSLAPGHFGWGGRPVPSRSATPDELSGLLEEVAGRGLAEITYGPPLEAAELAAVSRRLGVRVTWGALLTDLFGSADETRALLEVLTTDADVWPQVSCREIVVQATLAHPHYFAKGTDFTQALAEGIDRRELYRDPAWRDRVDGQLAAARPGVLARTSVAESERHPDLVGRPLSEVAAARGVRPLDALLDVALEDDLATRFRVVSLNHDEELLGALLRDPRVVLGAHDAGAHVDELCDAVFPTHLLSHWVRDRGALDLETAVWRLAGQPAEVFGLHDRGRVAPGLAADLVAFDADRVAPHDLERRWDLPAEGDRLVAGADGIEHVWVNGQRVVTDGEDTAAHPGVVLRGGCA